MTISRRCSPLAFFYGDLTVHHQFPFEFTDDDPGGGSAGSSSIAVQLRESVYPAWQANTDYSAGAIIRPTAINGLKYTAQNSGRSGGSEPIWLTQAELVPGTADNNINWLSSHDDSRTVLAWSTGGIVSVATGLLPPAGYPAQPSVSQLQGALNWWPQGFHHAGQVSWSPNFGVVCSSITGLTPNGTVALINFCFPYTPTGVRKWQFLGYSSFYGGETPSKNPYYDSTTFPNGTPHGGTWNIHLGYDIKRRKDIVTAETAVGTTALEVYELGATIPAIRGTKIWQGTNGDRNLGRSFWVEGGFQRIQLPWLGQWWVIQYGQSQASTDQVWGFTPTATPASSGSSTPAGFAVTVPTEIHARAKTGAGNLHFTVDQMGQRVFACQADTSQAAVGGRYPLKVWEVNPITYAWVEVSIPVTLRVQIAQKLNLNPLCYLGGYRFMYFEPRPVGEGVSDGDNLVSGGNFPSGLPDPTPTQVKKTGGFYPYEIFLPKATSPRTMTWTPREWTGSALNGESWSKQKHVEMAYNSSDGKMYCFGGDHGWGASGGNDPSWPLGVSGAYNNQVISFLPETNATVTLEEGTCPVVRGINHPIRVDENGFQYRSVSNDFWMMVGYGPGDWTNQCGWVNRAEWTAAGGNKQIYRWSVSGGWSQATQPTPESGFEAYTWSVGESNGARKWYYDSSADRLIAPVYGVTTIQIYNPNDGTFRRYRADRCHNGLGGNTLLTPDGRPLGDPVVGAGSKAWFHDRGCVDVTTGHFYIFAPATGDVFRIHTRSNFFTTDSEPAARTEWVTRIIPTQSRSYNLTHLVFARGALWIFMQSFNGRLRVFSWAEGESHATEHRPPQGAVGTCIAKYGDERICVIGNQASSSWGTVHQAQKNRFYTITLS